MYIENCQYQALARQRVQNASFQPRPIRPAPAVDRVSAEQPAAGGSARKRGGRRPSIEDAKIELGIVRIEPVAVPVAPDGWPRGSAAPQRVQNLFDAADTGCSKRSATSTSVIGLPRSSRATIRSEKVVASG